MTNASHTNEPQHLYEMSWAYTPSSIFAFDSGTGILIDANPAAEALSKYSREELIGLSITMLHPEDERERVLAEYLKPGNQPTPHPDLHLQCKDGRCIPIRSSTSKSVLLDGRTISICVYLDITDRVAYEHQLSTQNWALSAYALAALALGQVRPSEELLLQAICDAITYKSIYVLAWIGVMEEGPEESIRVAAKGGTGQGFLDGIRFSYSKNAPEVQGPTGTCIRTGKLQVMEDSETVAAFRPWREQARKYGICSIASIPLRIEDGWRGSINVGAAQPNSFEPMAIEVLQHLAEQIQSGVHAVEQRRLLLAERAHAAKIERQLTETLSAMVAPIVLAMEMRDPYTAGHQGRVAEIAVAIGKEMGWTEARLQGLRVAAQVHDIGKISIPAEILTKPGGLNAAERAMINQHSETGYTILKDIPFVWPIAEIVRQHHEKLDGSGYPLGLKTDAILPEAKVLAVADIVEAMASYRPYRPGIPLDVVLEEIEKESGTLLDAETVRICVDLFRRKHFMVPGWIRS
jgi:PAS domain S-box-containing protein